MQTAQLADLIKGRRSIRAWQDLAGPEDLLRQAVELATWAPNAGNQQIWHFYIILSKKTINALADAVQAKAEYVAAWPEAAALGDTLTRMRRGSVFFRNAPAAVAVAARQYVTPTDQLIASRAAFDAGAKMIQDGRLAANARIQTVGSAIGYLCLVLHQLGLGATYMTGPMQAKSDFERILDVPKDLEIVAFIPVGYPAENPTRPRKPLDEVCQTVR